MTDNAGQSTTSVSATLTVVGPPITSSVVGSILNLSWPNDMYKLQQSSSLISSDCTDVPGATSPYPVALVGPGKFFRAVRR